MGGKPKIRGGDGKVGPVVTDNGNFMIDVDFGLIGNPAELEQRLKMVPWIVETGLFVNMADPVYLGKRNKVEKLERKKQQEALFHLINEG